MATSINGLQCVFRHLFGAVGHNGVADVKHTEGVLSGAHISGSRLVLGFWVRSRRNQIHDLHDLHDLHDHMTYMTHTFDTTDMVHGSTRRT